MTSFSSFNFFLLSLEYMRPERRKDRGLAPHPTLIKYQYIWEFSEKPWETATCIHSSIFLKMKMIFNPTQCIYLINLLLLDIVKILRQFSLFNSPCIFTSRMCWVLLTLLWPKLPLFPFFTSHSSYPLDPNSFHH